MPLRDLQFGKGILLCSENCLFHLFILFTHSLYIQKIIQDNAGESLELEIERDRDTSSTPRSLSTAEVDPSSPQSNSDNRSKIGSLRLLVRPELKPDGSGQGKIGIQLIDNVQLNVIKPENTMRAVSSAWKQFTSLTGDVSVAVVQIPVQLLARGNGGGSGNENSNTVSGPIGIVATGAGLIRYEDRERKLEKMDFKGDMLCNF